MPLLDPAMCTVLLLNPDSTPLSGTNAPVSHVSKRQRLVRSAAAATAVPFYIASRMGKDGDDRQAVLDLPADGAYSYSPASLRNLWTDRGLSRTIAAHKRSSLIVAGSWLEIDVTFLTLTALADGFDLHILVDASPSQAADIRQAAMDRIIQAGAVPLSAPQMLGEWAERAQDDARRAALLELVASEYPVGSSLT
ncbi:MAG: isochorismatase family protein [Hyphomicrobiaceae bacterium]